MQAVILAGGEGTRLRPYTAVLPKALVPLGDMPVLEIVVRQLRARDITRLHICAGHLAQLIMAYFGDGASFGVQIAYTIEPNPLGTAGPLRLIEDLDDDFLVLNGDLLTTLDPTRLIEHHHRQQADATMGVYRRQIAIDFGVLEFDADMQLQEYREKPAITHDVSMGIHVLSRRVLRHIETGRRFDIPDLMRAIIAAGGKVVGFAEDCFWLDIGRVEDYQHAQDEFERHRQRFLPEPVPAAALHV